jgi:hypothetical protein
MKQKFKLYSVWLAIIIGLLACSLSGNSNQQNAENSNSSPSTDNANNTDNNQAPAATDTLAPVLPTDTPIPVTLIPTDGPVTLQVTVDTNCRFGPRVDYLWIGAVVVGETVEVIKQPPGNQPYLVVESKLGECWVWLEYATVFGDPSVLPIASIPATPTPIPPGSIQGVVWLDLCSSGAPGDPPTGCLEGDPNVYYGNGLLEVGEPGLNGVVVDLGEGACPATGYATAETNAVGHYNFADVPAGDYCLSIEVFAHSNGDDLIPGWWSHPLTSETLTSKNITVVAGEDLIQQHFGWDFQLD